MPVSIVTHNDMAASAYIMSNAPRTVETSGVP